MSWDIIENFLSNMVFGVLLFTTIIYWINLFFFKWGSKLALVGRIGSVTANITLFFILGLRWVIAGYFPLSNLYESLLFLTWTLLLVYLYIEFKTNNKLIGSILIPVALLINGFANLTLPIEMQKASPLVPALQSNWLMLHVSMMMFSYGTLIVGSLLSILFLVIAKGKQIDFTNLDKANTSYLNTLLAYYEEKSTKISHQFTDLGKLKLLSTIDNWSYRIIGLGFPFLTIGIIAGGVWANEAWGSYWSWDPKETWALITWIVFAAYLHSRLTKGWAGTKTAFLGSLGFFVIWICYLGVNFLGKGLHSYGWLS
jgi:cytochrome c-type biogenesis protein CcsB|uniref:heme attachment to plastid cytochromec n=1 Tax=Tenuicylindrus belgicus TaxID=1398096 RepID=UPI002237DAF8|nr:heme attachment to plastid cytochromec [Tenuicylindrus belgicus]UYC31573.1 heme attachment to plastid cytochromec [Tenuicylindrus belgicus]